MLTSFAFMLVLTKFKAWLRQPLVTVVSSRDRPSGKASAQYQNIFKNLPPKGLSNEETEHFDAVLLLSPQIMKELQ